MPLSITYESNAIIIPKSAKYTQSSPIRANECDHNHDIVCNRRFVCLPNNSYKRNIVRKLYFRKLFCLKLKSMPKVKVYAKHPKAVDWFLICKKWKYCGHPDTTNTEKIILSSIDVDNILWGYEF